MWAALHSERIYTSEIADCSPDLSLEAGDIPTDAAVGIIGWTVMCRRGTGLSCRWAQGRVAAVAPPVASTGTPADDSVQLPNVLVQFESTALPIPLSLRLHNFGDGSEDDTSRWWFRIEEKDVAKRDRLRLCLKARAGDETNSGLTA